jgi:hypothetical protein
MRVLDVTVEPGERENLHHHRWPSLMVVLARPNYRNFDADGNEIPPSGGTPASPALPRALRLPRSSCTPLRSRLTHRTPFRTFGSSSKRLRSKNFGRSILRIPQNRALPSRWYPISNCNIRLLSPGIWDGYATKRFSPYFRKHGSSAEDRCEASGVALFYPSTFIDRLSGCVLIRSYETHTAGPFVRS